MTSNRQVADVVAKAPATARIAKIVKGSGNVGSVQSQCGISDHRTVDENLYPADRRPFLLVRRPATYRQHRVLRHRAAAVCSSCRIQPSERWSIGADCEYVCVVPQL